VIGGLPNRVSAGRAPPLGGAILSTGTRRIRLERLRNRVYPEKEPEIRKNSSLQGSPNATTKSGSHGRPLKTEGSASSFPVGEDGGGVRTRGWAYPFPGIVPFFPFSRGVGEDRVSKPLLVVPITAAGLQGEKPLAKRLM
jgi:hypothetical protein